ncbi:bifunctional phosphopantothenoylcysteine decarboxylase/phosphopantothenate--cysteine ligase CoaBC [Capnocytophaga ochracea]|jgi:phosphopantothenoylcysteine decarboxylase/phosphopantothenate--cysteine ligase|uniref:bifunctional phosphopantothenoylcysteine decarboxylase/phosphopantothenate--cysteine ligase CoaBC n=1 Tax=Capnocytophaga TaxID=1016 RepID=UPI0006B017CF|nr:MULTISPECIES: bifunctional phosphopantothenoylcysteine decarboxylase/phosphopantothenate--cysteine ligase CoaBC [Capnocytophaga]ALC98147.1 phosphopantothenoylcysteine decarboxylase [Capnocytophaga sp. oral taxon 323]MEB3016335.1 bifunctional phosphopantothenoylcysteine decarboxylase/phosphopantothenate--cysteine ligase CoaBC [Capnocytophaga ochracea]MEB3036871.1 bifunctional phosphopantothenoylcysteine decarboxylase/phosphopantothenate--cysteine ligase CoaBC [Capnocytophaga ochracea]
MNIVLGITAGIAAYKTPQLIRLLIKKEHNVKVILTENAKEFVTPLTLSTVSKSPVLTNFSSPEGNWHSHVELALWADAMLIAPATANTIGKMAHGVCDNLLLATYFSAKAPVFIAPAMDLDMYAHPTVTENLIKLKSFGNHIIPATYGELASGLVGQGRMAEPEDIVLFLENALTENLPFKGKKILITAGPTYEAIDPVRFIGNFSSGKMGIALANEAVRQGAEVHLILGSSTEKNIHSQIHLHRVVSAQQMYEAAVTEFPTCDIAILAAAVADYTPETVASEKIKKKGGNLSLTLVPTVDILASLGKIKTTQTLIGFALETENEVANAQTKLEKKNLDAIVLNSLRDAGAGFGTDTNKVTFITKKTQISFPLKTKEEVAKDILTQIFGILIEK